MFAAPLDIYAGSARGRDSGGQRCRPARGLLAALLTAVCALVLPASPAFGEGSADMNTGPGTEYRQTLQMLAETATTPGFPHFYTVLYVYARAGETVQLGSSAMELAGGGDNILVYAPGTDLEAKPFPTDPAYGTDIFDCNTNDPGTGRIATRAQELAGPEPSAGDADPATWEPCEFTPTQDGVYPIVMMPYDTTAGSDPGPNLDNPNATATQGLGITMWDITVRAAGDAVQPGRAFARTLSLITTSTGVSGLQIFPYTKTGYEWNVEMPDEAGVSWQMYVDDMGVIDKATGQRTFESFHAGQPVVHSDRGSASPDRRFPMFFNRADPVVISGDNGLGETLGYSTTPISQASNPLTGLAFTGSGGESGGTNRGSGGTIGFASPRAMEGLGYTIALDLNGDGPFGNANDIVDATNELSSSGSNSFAWNGRDAAGNVPACGTYNYQVRSTLGEVHFPEQDVENSGGKRFERLSLPNDPTLGNPLAASYDNLDRSKTPPVVTANTTPIEATNAISGPGFNSWSDGSGGDNDYIDTWARLPEVQATGTLRLLCADPQVVKSSDPSPATPGEDLTFRLEVRNNGPDAATNVVATDDLPDTVQFKSTSQGCSEAGRVVTCSLASLAAGATHTFEIRVAVPSDIDECIDNTATVTNATPDTNAGNNSSTICTPVKGRSDLSITKDPSRTQIPAGGGQVIYTLVVKNDGPSDDMGVEVSDPLAAGLTLVAADPSQGSCTTANNTVSCDLGTLKAGGSAQVLVTVNTHGAPGCITNTARVRGAHEDPDGGNNQASARVCVGEGPPTTFDLAVTKTANDKALVIGQRVRYQVVVTNNGPAAAPDVKMTDTLNAPVKVVSVQSTQGSCTKAIPMTCQLGTIPAGGKVTITIRVKHREPGCRQRQAASATANGTDPDPANNLDTVDVCVKRVPLRLSKVASRSSVRAGATLSYRIRVQNPSKGEARNVKVCDRLPSGLSLVSSRPTAKRRGGQRCWTIKSLKAGKSHTFWVTVRTAKGANGRKTNIATLSSPDSRRMRARDGVRVRGVATPVTG